MMRHRQYTKINDIEMDRRGRREEVNTEYGDVGDVIVHEVD